MYQQLKNHMFWDVQPRRLVVTDVSKDGNASIFRAKQMTTSRFLITPVNLYQSTRRNVTENLTVHCHRCPNLLPPTPKTATDIWTELLLSVACCSRNSPFRHHCDQTGCGGRLFPQDKTEYWRSKLRRSGGEYQPEDTMSAQKPTTCTTMAALNVIFWQFSRQFAALCELSAIRRRENV
jgi:hypothetical protein